MEALQDVFELLVAVGVSAAGQSADLIRADDVSPNDEELLKRVANVELPREDPVKGG